MGHHGVGRGRLWSLVLGAGLALAIVGGCKEQKGGYTPPPPAEVTVTIPQKREVTNALEFTGFTRGVASVEVRARVKGYIEKRFVEGGQRVKTGDVLYTIDPREFQAAVNQAQAMIAAQEAQLKLAEVTLNRVREAVNKEAAAHLELDKAQADRDAAEAQLDLAKAQLVQRKLDLEFTRVVSPIDGRLGIQTLDAGNLVGASEPTLLATVIDDSKIYARYSIDEQQLLSIRAEAAYKRPGEDGRDGLTVLLGLANEPGYPHVGRFYKADNTVDSKTGTLGVDSIFDNPDGVILPGAYVRVKAIFGKTEAFVLPDVAVNADQLGRYVLVVNDKNVVERRAVRVGASEGRLTRIIEGIDGSEHIVVNGLQRARPGSTVAPKMVDESTLIDGDAKAAKPEGASPAKAETKPDVKPASGSGGESKTEPKDPPKPDPK
ncbi:MAG: efflux RND transporter periplasmic adaptor subunit [Tepidisphaera sp.]|nr:efflux RND transporter periplasmic adaptor subunit [Tepidisphaera sp.]